jgi:hypothetical protein
MGLSPTQAASAAAAIAMAGYEQFSGGGGGHNQGDLPYPYAQNAPSQAGIPHLTANFADPYGLPNDAGLRASLEATELGYNRAGHQIRAAGLGSGGGHGGVQRGFGAQNELARGAAQARDLREWDQYRIDRGDDTMDRIIRWQNAYNQAYGISMGVPPEYDSTGDWLQLAALRMG